MAKKITPTPTPTGNRAKSSVARKGLSHDNGKRGRRTPAQLERQERVYMLSVVESLTVRQIAAKEKISQDTVIADLRHEYARRQAQLEARREAETARSISYYEAVGKLALDKSRMYDVLAQSGSKVVDHTLDAMLKSRERIDKLLGIESPTKVDLGIATLVDALKPK